MFALCCRRFFLAMYWQQGAAADYTYFLWFLENLFTRLYVVLKKRKVQKIYSGYTKRYLVLFFLSI
jgi:hypothetical protein